MFTFQCFQRKLLPAFLIYVTAFFLLIAGYEVKAAQCYSTPKSVAVVGAGSSGLTAARTLMEEGHQVVIFEKENRVGGKVYTFRTSPSTFVELGAILVMPDYYRITLGYAAEFGIPTFPYTNPFIILDEFGNKLTIQQFLFSRYTLPEIVVATQNYAAALAKFADFLGSPGLTSVPPDLELPYTEFAALYGIEPIAEAMRSLMATSGFTYYETVPAAYFLKATSVFLRVGPTGLVTPIPHIFPTGFQSVFDALAATMDVRLNSEVTQIDRSDEEVVVTVNGIDKHTFDKVVISAPLNVVPNFLDVTNKESQIFGQLETDRFFITVFGAIGVDEVLFYHDNARPDRINHVLGLVGMLDTSGILNGSAYQMTDRNIAPAEVVNVLADDLAASGGVFLGAFLQQEWTNYFPHVTTEAIRSGFYDNMETLQGKRHTYYVGSSVTMESVESVAQHAQDLVRRRFGKCQKHNNQIL